jgi:ATP-dependent Lon protease
MIHLEWSGSEYIATANSIDRLPSPIRDRFRIVKFPKPTADDLDPLLPIILLDRARERRLDHRWMRPFNIAERRASKLPGSL